MMTEDSSNNKNDGDVDTLRSPRNRRRVAYSPKTVNWFSAITRIQSGRSRQGFQHPPAGGARTGSTSSTTADANGTTGASGPIPAGQRHVSVPTSETLAAGASGPAADDADLQRGAVSLPGSLASLSALNSFPAGAGDDVIGYPGVSLYPGGTDSVPSIITTDMDAGNSVTTPASTISAAVDSSDSNAQAVQFQPPHMTGGDSAQSTLEPQSLSRPTTPGAARHQQYTRPPPLHLYARTVDMSAWLPKLMELQRKRTASAHSGSLAPSHASVRAASQRPSLSFATARRLTSGRLFESPLPPIPSETVLATADVDSTPTGNDARAEEEGERGRGRTRSITPAKRTASPKPRAHRAVPGEMELKDWFDQILAIYGLRGINGTRLVVRATAKEWVRPRKSRRNKGAAAAGSSGGEGPSSPLKAVYSHPEANRVPRMASAGASQDADNDSDNNNNCGTAFTRRATGLYPAPRRDQRPVLHLSYSTGDINEFPLRMLQRPESYDGATTGGSRGGPDRPSARYLPVSDSATLSVSVAGGGGATAATSRSRSSSPPRRSRTANYLESLAKTGSRRGRSPGRRRQMYVDSDDTLPAPAANSTLASPSSAKAALQTTSGDEGGLGVSPPSGHGYLANPLSAQNASSSSAYGDSDSEATGSPVSMSDAAVRVRARSKGGAGTRKKVRSVCFSDVIKVGHVTGKDEYDRTAPDYYSKYSTLSPQERRAINEELDQFRWNEMIKRVHPDSTQNMPRGRALSTD